MNDRSSCVECHEPPGGRSVLVCADCGGIFHFPDARVNEPGIPCGTHEIGFRDLLGRDVVPLCLRCAMAFRLRFGIPAR
ncbi:MAG: hypothetical protein IT303_03690 [Dehalococcoidia bacterium]|nr:hypothetical protein [Dehalococcoidia bacterium]